MHDDAINDIGTALMNLRATFEKHKIPIPDQLSFSDPRRAFEAKRALYSIAGSSALMQYRVSQNSSDMDTQIAGFKILWT